MLSSKKMHKKSFVILLILSVVVNYAVMLMDSLLMNNLIGGEAGLPFKFDSASAFGGGSINFLNLFLDIIFWFIVLLTIQKFFKKFITK